MRPPVVLIHGFLSSSDTWETFEDLLEDRIGDIWLSTADYRNFNMDHFEKNRKVPGTAAIAARNAYRNAGIAAAQVDALGHSMGSILCRIWADEDNPDYRRKSNYGAGDFNKLITIDSPHTGSPWATLGALLLANPASVWALEGLLGVPVDYFIGGFEDLQTDSAALCAMNLQPTDMPAHAIVGNFVSDVDDLADLACFAASTLDKPEIAAVCTAWDLFKFFGYDRHSAPKSARL